MYEIAKHEFQTWINSLKLDSLDEYEITLLSVIINNFDAIASVGTTSGKRSSVLSSKIAGLKCTTVNSLPKLTIESESDEKLLRIESLDVENFRGFGVVQNFSFDTQYSFYYGPNGSGKTSFCEALEYCMLGMIEEASSRSIQLDKYIIHAGKKSATTPVLKCKYSSGEIKEVAPNLTNYRFGFIEKNRIDNFSHISAATNKTQSERIATLFGLSEFQEFAKGFASPDSFCNDRYLLITPVARAAYNKFVEDVVETKKRLDLSKQTFDKAQDELSALISGIGSDKISTIDDVKIYYTDSEDGLITKYTQEAKANKWTILCEGYLDSLSKKINALILLYDGIKQSTTELLSDVNSLNLSDLYNAIMKLDDNSQAVCPACMTPLQHVVENPFVRARDELIKLGKIENAKKVIKENAKQIVTDYKAVFELIVGLEGSGIVSNVDFSFFAEKNLQLSELESLDENVVDIFSALKSFQTQLELLDKSSVVDGYNAKANEHNRLYDEKLEAAQMQYTAIIEKNASLEEQRKYYEQLLSQYNESNAKIGELKSKVELEQKLIDYNLKIVDAYKKVVSTLDNYVTKLPHSMSKDLSDKVKEYYNFINEGDADFELIKNLALPVVANEKIVIEMDNGLKHDALQILSEGHVKILGLSILLAKAVYEKSSFLIFDDIVNSVDDDHRDGVAKLLMTHNDFSNMQMILTCHGEIFVSMLEKYVSDTKKMTRYMFLPADSLEERGVFIKHQDASLPLKVARDLLAEDRRKECAAKCRQAVECIAGTLWGKVVRVTNAGISVKLRKMQSPPDLMVVLDSLHAQIKPTKVQGTDELYEDIGVLTSESMWPLLNKGTHYDETIPEFNRNDVKKLLELVEKIAKEVDSLKMSIIAIG